MLALNDEESVKYRQFILDGIHMAELQKREAQQVIAELNAMISTKPSSILDGLKQTAEINLARAENVLKNFGA